ncbi:MAG: V-type ATP synthase subunit E [Planctomycetota bacterium]
MSMERIKEAIIDEAEEKAREIESEARARCEKRLQQGKEEMEEKLQSKFEQGRQKVERETERRIIQERSQHNLKLLQRRNEILNQLFEEAARQIFRLPDDEYRELLAKWMGEIPDDASGTVICHADDAGRIRPLVDDMNGKRPENAQLQLREADHPEQGGVIFQGETFEIDMSVRTRVNELREEMAPVIADRIFPGNLKV